MQAGRDSRRVGNQKVDVEAQVGDGAKIAFQHRAIAGQPDFGSVVADMVLDELPELVPTLPVQAVDVAAISLDQLVAGHRFLPGRGSMITLRRTVTSRSDKKRTNTKNVVSTNSYDHLH